MRWFPLSGPTPGLVAVLLLTSACSSTGPTTVGGDVTMHLDANTAPVISLPAGTTLPPDTGANAGLIVGHCELTGEATEIVLARSADDASMASGFSWFQLTVDSPDAPYVGHVIAQYDDDVYEADCDLTSFARATREGIVDIDLTACTLMAPAPSGVNSVTVEADLLFDACTVR
jgi:hypothetical protein